METRTSPLFDVSVRKSFGGSNTPDLPFRALSADVATSVSGSANGSSSEPFRALVVSPTRSMTCSSSRCAWKPIRGISSTSTKRPTAYFGNWKPRDWWTTLCLSSADVATKATKGNARSTRKSTTKAWCNTSSICTLSPRLSRFQASSASASMSRLSVIWTPTGLVVVSVPRRRRRRRTRARSSCSGTTRS